MAILFFEGLPGAGKSYEAMATQIIPFLQKGREVVAYIEGLNIEKIAEVADLPVDDVRQRLHILTRDDMRPQEVKEGKKVYQVDGAWLGKVRDNALHVFDESQTWWPTRMKTSEALTTFISEHRHRGMDLLLIGQSLKDLNVLWRRRVDQKFTFLKLTALGSNKRYRVSIWKGQGNDDYVKVSDRVAKYDPKYFGTYSSHVSDDTNTETYTDSRANFLVSFGKWAVPLVTVILVVGGWKVWGFFHVEPPPAAVAARPAAAGAPVGRTRNAAAPGLIGEEAYFDYLERKGRVRLAGVVESADRSQVHGVVEWVEGDHVVDRLTFEQLRNLGVAVYYYGADTQSGAVRLMRNGWSVVATQWPVEPIGRVSAYRQDEIKGGR